MVQQFIPTKRVIGHYVNKLHHRLNEHVQFLLVSVSDTDPG